jgi:hypothetical protein
MHSETLERRVLAAGVAHLDRRVDALVKRIKQRNPSLFGSPIRQRMLQLYRNDAQFRTVVSIPHHLSFLAPETNIVITYRIVAYDRRGHVTGRWMRRVNHFETVQLPLDELVALDEYGLFTVSCKYDSAEGIDYLGQTSPQFMTIYQPRNSANAPQIIHSHKYLDRITPLARRVRRTSPLVEGAEGLVGLDYFVMNSSPRRLTGRIDLTDGAAVVAEASFAVNGHGVAKVAIPISGIGPYVMGCELDRVTNHRKPLVFRTFSSGMVTASHT